MDDAFVHFLHTHADATFYTTAAPGNSGDLLLQLGLTTYLRTHNFTVTQDAAVADIILMHGGGSIDDVWGTGLAHLLELLTVHRDKMVVVAPSTIHFTHTDLAAVLRAYTQPIHFFVRERYSYDRLNDCTLGANVTVEQANDTAFLLKNTPYIKKLQEQRVNAFTLCAMRTDRESRLTTYALDRPSKYPWEYVRRYIMLRRQKQFLAHHAPHVTSTNAVVFDDISYRDLGTFLMSVVRADEIHTDRLHVGILGALLGVPVHLYTTKYDKIQGVYEQSLHVYETVTLHGAHELHQ